jgi:hypothetical protein
MLNNSLNLYSMSRSSAVVSFTCFAIFFSQELQQTLFFTDRSLANLISARETVYLFRKK